MDPIEKVQQALLSAFITAFPAWQAARVAWENKAFEPPQATSWMAVAFMPVDSRATTLGADGYDDDNGLFQVDLNVPIGSGEADSRKTIDELRTCFKPGVLQYDGQAVTILSRSRAGGMTSNGFYKIPFTVRWRSQLNR